jgi:hypothetical protein
LEKFHSTLASDPDRASYGYQFVKHADEHLAVDELLITDQLFRAANVETRKQYVDLVESVRAHNGKVRFPLLSSPLLSTHLRRCMSSVECMSVESNWDSIPVSQQPCGSHS